MEFLNFGIILALVPIIQAATQGLKRDTWSTWTTRIFALLISMAVTYVVRQANIPEVSAALGNLWFAGLTAGVGWLMATGLYSQTKSDIANKIAKSETNVTIPAEVVDAKPGDPGTTPTVAPSTLEDFNEPSMEHFPPVVDPNLPQPEPEDEL